MKKMRYVWVAYVAMALVGALAVVLVIRFSAKSGQQNAHTTILLYKDPFKFCSFVSTADSPSANPFWEGPDLPAVITDKLAQILQTPGGGSALVATTVWRCDGGKVLACTVGANLNCGKANTSREPTDAMVQWCADGSHTDMPASVSGHETIYAWAWQDGSPVIVRQF